MKSQNKRFSLKRIKVVRAKVLVIPNFISLMDITEHY